MVFQLEAKVARFSNSLDHYVFGVIFSEWNGFVEDVWKTHQIVFHLVYGFCHFVIVFLNLCREFLCFDKERFRVFACFFGSVDVFCYLVSPGSELVVFAFEFTLENIEFEDSIDPCEFFCVLTFF